MTLKRFHNFFELLELSSICTKFMSSASSHPKLNLKSFPHVKRNHKCLREFSRMPLVFINTAGKNEKIITIFSNIQVRIKLPEAQNYESKDFSIKSKFYFMQSSMEPDLFLKALGKFKCMNQILKS